MRVERAALQLGMELDPDEPGVVGPLDILGQRSVGRHSGEYQPAMFERVTLIGVDLIAMAMPFADFGLAID